MRIKQPEQPFAFALSEAEEGWRWKVIDREGDSVAIGLAGDKATAQECVAAVYRSEGALRSRQDDGPSATTAGANFVRLPTALSRRRG